MNDVQRLWKDGQKIKAIGYGIVYAVGAVVIGFIFWLTSKK